MAYSRTIAVQPKPARNGAAVVNDFWPVASECDFAAAILQEFDVSKTCVSYVVTSLIIGITYIYIFIYISYIYIHIHTYTYIQYSTLLYITSHCIALHYITLHHITLPYMHTIQNTNHNTQNTIRNTQYAIHNTQYTKYNAKQYNTVHT